ncbi:non-specific lipid transfer protein GPI-anchored 14-like [Cornus florida]|uniref:non-specific lipid transfer protein GPI-anchored 14-like n=1 Tax=Cornus florida TaxID=4283 RepID=UPI0028A07D5B|nr:non-specific lipid transfer protein GPI-anchored 14-like [Cornus florida]
MDSKHMSLQAMYSCMLLMVLVGFANSDIAKDREECADQLVGLTTCLPYVGGDSKAPTLDCCTGIKQVLQNSKKCLCVLVKDRNDPSLGLKINATLALGLPTTCHAPSNVSECPSLLHLAPNSPDAKVFEEFTNSTKGSNSVPAANGNSTQNGTSAELNSSGGSGKRRLGVEIAWGIILALLFHISYHMHDV